MSIVTSHMSISLDGYVAGPDQSREEPLGRDGERLHDWAFAEPLDPGDTDVLARSHENVRAFVMGRNMFTAGRGAWDPDWRGWWGEDPPYHAPVFVLTHHPRASLEMQGGTTFHFVTDGLDAALQRARAAAGDGDVMIAGGASTLRQGLAGGHLDVLSLHVVPRLLGAGERLLDGAGHPQLEIEDTVASPRVTHVRYRVVRTPSASPG